MVWSPILFYCQDFMKRDSLAYYLQLTYGVISFQRNAINAAQGLTHQMLLVTLRVVIYFPLCHLCGLTLSGQTGPLSFYGGRQ